MISDYDFVKYCPEQISGRMKYHKLTFYVCPETIYQFVYRSRNKELYYCLPYKKPKRQKRPFGDMPLSEFTPAQIDAWRTQRLKDGTSTETVNRDIATFKAAISKAVLWGIIETHPLEKLKLLKTDRSGKIRYLASAEEAQLRETLIARETRMRAERMNANKWRADRSYELFPDISNDTFTDHLRPMILLSINTGIRRGELFSLKWENNH